MQKTYNDSKKDYFKSQQTILNESIDYSVSDYENAAFKEALGLEATNQVTVDIIRRWFFAKGYSNAYSSNLSDLWYDWLGSQGFTSKSLRDRFKEFYNSNVGLDI